MKKILVVDDDDDMRRSIATVLKSEGFTVFEADNGETGFEKAIEHSPHLAIIDIDIPNINGFILSEMLKEHSETVDIAIILITGMAQNAYAWKFDDKIVYLEKPFDDAALILAVESHTVVIRTESPIGGSGKPCGIIDCYR